MPEELVYLGYSKTERSPHRISRRLYDLLESHGASVRPDTLRSFKNTDWFVYLPNEKAGVAAAEYDTLGLRALMRRFPVFSEEHTGARCCGFVFTFRRVFRKEAVLFKLRFG